MTPINLISEKYIKDNSTIDENVDVKLVMPFVRMAQDKYLEKLLTKDLINEIYDQVRNNNLSQQNRDLLNFYVSPCLLWYVIKESTPYLLFKYRNKAISTQGGDQSNPINHYEMESLVNKANDNANSYAYRLTEFLYENRLTYTLYSCPKKPIGNFSISFKNNRREKIRRENYK